jgi:hypothetical protein
MTVYTTDKNAESQLCYMMMGPDIWGPECSNPTPNPETGLCRACEAQWFWDWV